MTTRWAPIVVRNGVRTPIISRVKLPQLLPLFLLAISGAHPKNILRFFDLKA